MPQNFIAIHHPDNCDRSLGGEVIEGEATQRKSPSTPMSNQLTRRDFAIRTAGFGLAGFNLAMGLAPAATLAEAGQASRSETSPAVADPYPLDPYSLVDPELLPALKQFPAFDLSAEMVAQVPAIARHAPVTCSRAAARGAAYPRAAGSTRGSSLDR